MENLIQIVELANIEIYEFCVLNLKTGKISYKHTYKKDSLIGWYYHNNNCFFVLDLSTNP